MFKHGGYSFNITSVAKKIFFGQIVASGFVFTRCLISIKRPDLWCGNGSIVFFFFFLLWFVLSI